MINDLKQNIDGSIEILKEIAGFMKLIDEADYTEEKILREVIESDRKKLRIINSSLPEILKGISLEKKIKGAEKNSIQKIEIDSKNLSGTISSGKGSVIVSLNKKDREKFLNELHISLRLLKKLKKKSSEKKEKSEEYQKTRGYAKFANALFRKKSESLLEKKYLLKMQQDLRKSDMNILAVTYVSMGLLSTLLSFLAGTAVFIFLMFFDISLSVPFFSMYQGGFIERILKTFWIIIIFPVLTATGFYFYPYTEKKSIEAKINNELPFVAIHMASISGSGIEPSQIFKIMALSRDYKYTGKQMRKLLNQINVYGYDLATALKNSAKNSPSDRLSELFKGLASSIMTGGDLNEFLEKRSETLLLQYRLEREKFAKTAETFMDIYISLVIAAPMILLLLLIMISISGLGFGVSPGVFTFGIASSVAFINIIFLVLLGAKQPGY